MPTGLRGCRGEGDAEIARNGEGRGGWSSRWCRRRRRLLRGWAVNDCAALVTEASMRRVVGAAIYAVQVTLLSRPSYYFALPRTNAVRRCRLTFIYRRREYRSSWPESPSLTVGFTGERAERSESGATPG